MGAAAAPALAPIPAGQVPVASPTSTSWAPSAKVSAGVLASAVTVLIIQFVPHANTWGAAVGGAITQVITFVVQYWVPERK